MLWGTGEPSREFLYVDDAARALLLAAERLAVSDPVNIGTGSETTHPRPGRDDRAARRLRGRDGLGRVAPRRPAAAFLDVSRARELIGFEAQVPLEDGLRETIESFRAQHVAAS